MRLEESLKPPWTVEILSRNRLETLCHGCFVHLLDEGLLGLLLQNFVQMPCFKPFSLVSVLFQ